MNTNVISLPAKVICYIVIISYIQPYEVIYLSKTLYNGMMAYSLPLPYVNDLFTTHNESNHWNIIIHYTNIEVACQKPLYRFNSYTTLHESGQHNQRLMRVCCLFRSLSQERGKRFYYAFESICYVRKIICWVVKKYILNTLVTMVLVYGMGIFGGRNPLGKCLKMSASVFPPKFSKPSNKHHTPSYFLKQNYLPLRSWLCKGLFHTCLRFKKVPHIDFLESHGK